MINYPVSIYCMNVIIRPVLNRIKAYYSWVL